MCWTGKARERVISPDNTQAVAMNSNNPQLFQSTLQLEDSQ